MREAFELTEAERAVEQRLTALLTLPEPPPALDARILAAARARAAQPAPAVEQVVVDVDPAQAPAPAGRLLRVFRGLSAAAGLLLVGLLALQLTQPTTRHLSQAHDPELHLSALGLAKVVDAEGALGDGARAKRPGSWVAQGEPLHVRPGGFLQLELACGTRLVLDGGSSGRLAFDPSARWVHLERGRVYADVVKVGRTRATPAPAGGSPRARRSGRDAERQGAAGAGVAYRADARPILVGAPGGVTRVVGTQLVVKASAARSQVTVREGVVELINRFGRSRVPAGHTGLLAGDAAPLARKVASVARHFRWMGKIQRGPRHPCEKPFGGVVGDDEPAIGSLTARGPDGPVRLTLERQAITVHVEDGLARTTAELVFANDGAARLEGTFRFALPRGADLARYAVEQGGALREGVVVERERAKQIYAQQKQEGRQTGLVAWDPGDAFTARVFPIEPRSEKRIVIGYTSELPERDGVSRLVVPLVSEAARAHPPERLTLRVRLSGPESGAPLRCPSHRVLQRFTDAGQELLLEAEGLRPRNDFVLELAQPDPPAVEARVEPTPNEPDSLLVRVRPPLVARGARAWADGPLVVLCDASASQAGTLKEVQLELLEGLLERVADPRDVRVFAGHVDAVELVASEFGPRADGLLSALWRAPTGGALDLSRCLTTLGRRLPPDAGATLVVIGDGLSTAGRRAPHQVLGALRSLPEAQVRRVIGVGLGSRVDARTLGALARERGGVFVTLRPGDDLGRKLDEVVSAVGEPVLTDVSVALDLPGLTAQAPRRLANLRRGETLTVSARRVGNSASGFVVVQGLLGGRPYRFRAPLQLTPVVAGETLARRWARRRVDALSLQGPRAAEQILDLGLRYGLVTDRTSLLVLEPDQLERYRLKRRAQATPAALALVRRAIALDSSRQRRALLLRALVKDPRCLAAQRFLGVERAGEIGGRGVVDRNEKLFAAKEPPKLEVDETVEKPIIVLEEEVEVTQDVPKGTDLSSRTKDALRRYRSALATTPDAGTRASERRRELTEQLKQAVRHAHTAENQVRRLKRLTKELGRDDREELRKAAEETGQQAQQLQKRQAKLEKRLEPLREQQKRMKATRRLESAKYAYDDEKKKLPELANKKLDKTSITDAYGVGGGAAGAYGRRPGQPYSVHDSGQGQDFLGDRIRLKNTREQSGRFEFEKHGGGGGVGGVIVVGSGGLANTGKDLNGDGKVDPAEAAFESTIGRPLILPKLEFEERAPGKRGGWKDEWEDDGWDDDGRTQVWSSGPGANGSWPGTVTAPEYASGRDAFRGLFKAPRRPVNVNTADPDVLVGFARGTLGDRYFATNHEGVTFYSGAPLGALRTIGDKALTDMERARRIAEGGIERTIAQLEPVDVDLGAGFQLLVTGEATPVQLGRQLLAAGRRAEAVRAFSALVEDAPESADAHTQYAKALLRCGLVDAALTELAEAARLDPTPQRALTLAQTALRTGRVQLAERVLTALLRTPLRAQAKALLLRLYRAALKRKSARAEQLRERIERLGR